MADEFVTVAQLRAEMARILARLGKARGHIYLMQRGLPRAVLVDIKEYQALIDQLEYLDDSIQAILADQRFERGEEKALPVEEVIRRRMEREAGLVKRAPKRRVRARVSR
jgi:PHD/YefM family antitoxin component YafN of YafNO toxin-antitoxin module